ncbi:unnamed protein product [Allacma fusca]|uniref:Mitochondrial GTPase 1 n=1 Tax=Allacma fusca TaxID=39272 RepID=A0A8J2JWR8_9HEXA|nr:unnamed protein product [Allacma fusca]
MATFRGSFGAVAAKGATNWFPKHMNSGLKQMQAKLRSVDCVIEIHDARIPMTGRHTNFAHQIIGNKPHILLLNKSDLISHGDIKRIASSYECSNVNSLLFTSLKNDQDDGVRQLIPTMRKLVEGSERYGRSLVKEYHAMIVGVPNVGKSSLINMLRAKHLKKGRAVKVGPSAGVTKCVHEKVRICENPQIFLFDTPGILSPKTSDLESGLKLAVCGNLPDHQVGETFIADYLLFLMNKKRCFKYVKYFGLKGPSDCITTVLTAGAVKFDYMNKIRSIETDSYVMKPDLNLVATHFLTTYRKGELGKLVLDEITTTAALKFKKNSELDDGDYENFQNR